VCASRLFYLKIRNATGTTTTIVSNAESQESHTAEMADEHIRYSPGVEAHIVSDADGGNIAKQLRRR
jgi:hypothetical protein